MGKINRTGETKNNNQGLSMKIIRYGGTEDIDVEFEDGTIVYGRAYGNFRKGAIKYPDIKREGESSINSQGLKMKIIRYGNCEDVDVEFEDGITVKNMTYQNFKKGTIKNYCVPEVFGVGYLGFGKYKSGENGKHTEVYQKWKNMLERCYCPYYINKQITYKDCIVYKDWHNFQNFADWFMNNIWSDDCTCLDKDILIRGNKLYSSETCVLVDSRINNLFTKQDNARGDLPIGVTYKKSNGKYIARCNVGKKRMKHLGYFTTPLEAFLAYKSFKEFYIKQIADEYFNKYPRFPYKLLKAMYEYEVDIND